MTSNKTKQIDAGKKSEHIISNTKLINSFAKEIRLILGLAQDLKA